MLICGCVTSSQLKPSATNELQRLKIVNRAPVPSLLNTARLFLNAPRARAPREGAPPDSCVSCPVSVSLVVVSGGWWATTLLFISTHEYVPVVCDRLCTCVTKRTDMANEEAIGPRKTMAVLVIVVGCFAVLWPRILSPVVLGTSRDQLQPNKFDREAEVKQERPPIRGASPHPALRERGRAIPAGAPATPTRASITMPPHHRPPPIPGMRPPMGGGSGPVPVPKTSMNIFMPIYTICIIVFFVYTLSKILFKRTGGTTYEGVSPDPHFRKRVFRDDSRTTPDTKLVVSAISGLVAEVQQQMEEVYTNNQQRTQDARDEANRPHSNGIGNSQVRIVATEYREKTPRIEEETEVIELDHTKEAARNETTQEISSHVDKDIAMEKEENIEDINETEKDITKDNDTMNELLSEVTENNVDAKFDELFNYSNGDVKDLKDTTMNLIENERDNLDDLIEKDNKEELISGGDLGRLEDVELDQLAKEETIEIAKEIKEVDAERPEVAEETPKLLADALKEDSDVEYSEDEDSEVELNESPTVKVLGMETTAHPADGGAWPRAEPQVTPTHAKRPLHTADEVKSIYLETDIPQQSRVLVTDFVDRADGSNEKHSQSPLVVSGKMTLSLIQDLPRSTPEREESTVDDFTTASAVTQPPANQDIEESESEEEIEIEEVDEEEEIIEEEIVEEIEEEEEEDNGVNKNHA